MKPMGKRGQVTFFIILGIIIVIIALLIVYLKGEIGVKEYIPKGVIVPEQAKGFTNYIENCISELSLEGLNFIGLQGGYVYVPNNLRNNPMRTLQFDDLNAIPYWVYADGNSVPSKEFMEEQLKGYIETNFDERCKFDDFLNQGYKIDYEKIKVNVKINDENVEVKLNSGLDIEFKEVKFPISDYLDIRVDTDIGKMHNMAKKIVEKELKDGALEFNTMNLIAIYSREDPKKLPPLAGIDFKCGKTIWLKPSVKKNMEQILIENVPKLRVLKTNYQAYDDVFYNSMTWDVFNENYNDITVNFNYYDSWPLDLDVYPSKGAVIKADSFDTFSPFMFLCTNLYHFVYDVSYPVIITMKNEEGYIFRFPILVDVRDNYAREKFFKEDVEEVETQSLFCDLNQRLSEPIEINIFDADTGKNLEEVSVNYLCGAEACNMGETDKDGRLKTRFPFCSNGDINFIKDGYLTNRQDLDLNPGGPIMSVNANLEPFKEVSVSAKVYETLNRVVDVTSEEYLSENSTDLNEKERFIVQLNKISDYNINEYDYQTSFVIEGNTKESVDLVPGSYDVQINLIYDAPVTIPKKTVKEKLLGVITIKEITIPEQTFDSIILGTVEYNFNILPNDLNKEIEFYALSRGIPKSYDDLEKIFNVQYNSEQYSNYLIPKFK